jgi:hypothetical protein
MNAIAMPSNAVHDHATSTQPDGVAHASMASTATATSSTPPGVWPTGDRQRKHRPSTGTAVRVHFGYAVARAYAGHNDRTDFGTTATYVRADLYETVAALAALTGETHPLLADR